MSERSETGRQGSLLTCDVYTEPAPECLRDNVTPDRLTLGRPEICAVYVCPLPPLKPVEVLASLMLSDLSS